MDIKIAQSLLSKVGGKLKDGRIVCRSSGRSPNKDRVAKAVNMSTEGVEPVEALRLMRLPHEELLIEAADTLKEDSVADIQSMDCIDWVRHTADKIGMRFDELGRLDLPNSDAGEDHLMEELYKYNRDAKQFALEAFPIDLVKNAIGILQWDIAKSSIQSRSDNLKFDGDSRDDQWEKFVGLLKPKGPTKEKYHVQALKHYLWQIKRKLSGGKVLDPLMIFVSGVQGAGKSSIIRVLNEGPLGRLYSEQDISEVADARNTDSRRYLYSILADEMHTSKETQVAAMKKMITSKEETNRLLGTNTSMVVENNTTWAGTSNHPLSSVVYDETGMRRFWEIQCGVPKGQTLDWEALSQIDPLDLWRSVDENLETGYYSRLTDTYDHMVAHQNLSVAKSQANVFLTMRGFLDFTEAVGWVKLTDIYKSFRDWSKDSGMGLKSYQNVSWFERKALDSGIKHHVSNNDIYLWLNNPDNKPVGDFVQPSDDAGYLKAPREAEDMKETAKRRFVRSGDVTTYDKGH